MHELGVVFYIADSVEKIAAENQAEHVSRVVLRIGEVSTIVNDYLEDCWKWNAKRRPMLDGCELEIETVPAVTYCEDCGGKYETVVHGKICPFCRSERTYLLQGNETEIKEIVVDDLPSDCF